MEGYLPAALGSVHSVQSVTCFSKVVTVYIVKTNLVNDGSSIYLTSDGGFSSLQSDAVRFVSRDTAAIVHGFRIVKLVPRRG